jgi:hypothetical protein
MSNSNNRPGKNPSHFSVTTIYGHNTKKPIVQLQVGKEQIQMSIETARDLAQNLIQAAEAALTDAFIYEFIEKRIGATDPNVAGFAMIELRKFRSEKRKEEGRQD